MEKQIVPYTYWLGVISMAVALVWRALNAVGLKGMVMTITYMTFYKGAVLFFLMAVATTSYSWLKSKKS